MQYGNEFTLKRRIYAWVGFFTILIVVGYGLTQLGQTLARCLPN